MISMRQFQSITSWIGIIVSAKLVGTGTDTAVHIDDVGLTTVAVVDPFTAVEISYTSNSG